ARGGSGRLGVRRVGRLGGGGRGAGTPGAAHAGAAPGMIHAAQTDQGAHQRRGGDEQHHQHLDHLHQVQRDPLVGLHEATARGQAREEQARQHDADPPSSATVIASKPMLPATPSVSRRSVPSTWTAPASPTRAPATASTRNAVRAGEMPATWAARGFEPTARKWNPIVERLISHHSATAAPAARNRPAWRRNPEPSSSGSAAFSPTDGEVGWDWLAPVNAAVFSAKNSR